MSATPYPNPNNRYRQSCTRRLPQMKITYIGLGSMGSPMAKNLIKAGLDVTVFDVVQEKIKDFLELGAKGAKNNVDAVRQADIVFTSLPGPKQSMAAMPEIIEAMKPNAVWVDVTTNDRELLLTFSNQAAKKNIAVLESPVTGAVDGAHLGKLTMFAGGESDVLEKVEPFLRYLGKPIHCGPLGMGNVVKLITNQIWFINAAAIGEALALGKKSGIDLLVLWEALKNSVGDTFVCRHDVPSIFAGHYDPSFTLDLCCKDLDLLADLGSKTATQIDMTKLAQEKFELAKETFGGDQAEMLVCKLVEEASSVQLQVEGDWPKHWEA
ncbi:MAG: NAD(P)-dependent oxidoreductase [Chloroflexota bacterium]